MKIGVHQERSMPSAPHTNRINSQFFIFFCNNHPWFTCCMCKNAQFLFFNISITKRLHLRHSFTKSHFFSTHYLKEMSQLFLTPNYAQTNCSQMTHALMHFFVSATSTSGTYWSAKFHQCLRQSPHHSISINLKNPLSWIV